MSGAGTLFSWTITALFAALTLLLGYESWALLTNHTPITEFIRPAVHSYPGIAFVVAVVLGMILGHFLWGPAYGRTSPEGMQSVGAGSASSTGSARKP